MYSVDQSEQLIIFIGSLGVGFLLGIVYDVFRAIRLSFTKSKVAVVVSDVLYFTLFALATFIYALAANKGEVRSYIIIGELSGAAFYYFSFGLAVIKLTDRFVTAFNRFKAFLFKVISAPFRLIRKVFGKLYRKIWAFLKKSEKKSEKIQKNLLPKARLYVYNLLGIFGVGKTHFRKGGGDFGKEKNEQKQKDL